MPHIMRVLSQPIEVEIVPPRSTSRSMALPGLGRGSGWSVMHGCLCGELGSRGGEEGNMWVSVWGVGVLGRMRRVTWVCLCGELGSWGGGGG